MLACVGSPLDDALGRLDAEEAAEAASAQLAAQDLARRRARFCELTADFLERMRALGDPGAKDGFPSGQRRPKTVRTWTLRYRASTEKDMFMTLTVDGEVPFSRNEYVKGRMKYVSGFARYTAAEVTFRDDELDELALSMAAVIRAHS